MSTARGANWSLLFAGMVAGSTIVYTIVNSFMFNELRAGNELVRHEQAVALRPYLNVEWFVITYDEAATPNEEWNLHVSIQNRGPLPAPDVTVYLYADSNETPAIEQPPSSAKHYALSPNGGAVTVVHKTMKSEAVKYMRDNGGWYFHCLVWYQGPDDGEYVSKVSYKIEYEEGIKLDWEPVYLENT